MTRSATVLAPLAHDPVTGHGLFGGAERAVASLLERHGGVTNDAVLMAAALAVWAHRTGHACVDTDDVASILDAAVRRSGSDWELPPLPPGGDLRAALRGAHEVVRVVDPDHPGSSSDALADGRPLVLWGTLLYAQRQFVDELSVAQRVTALAASSPPPPDGEALAFVDAVLPADGHDNAQNLVGRAVLTQSFNVLTGGPGTGKTHTLTRCLLAYLAAAHAAGDDVTVAVCAPTGKAATRASEMLRDFVDDHAAEIVRAAALDAAGLPAGADKPVGVTPEVLDAVAAVEPVTIHRLLGRAPGMDTRFAHHANRPLAHDLIIVDETSMVSLQLMARLLEAVRPGARVLLVGDEAQLESVESGSVLRDVTLAGSVLGGHVHQLRKVYRVAQGNPIAEVAPLVRDGAPESLDILRSSDDDRLRLVELAQGDRPGMDQVRSVLDAFVAVRDGARSLDHESHVEALGVLAGTRVLCGARRGPFGVEHFNDVVDDHLGLHPDRTIEVGRALLVTVNSPRVGLDNGDIGLVVRTHEGIRVLFAARQGLLSLTPAELPPVERAYAMTVHKSQGSEYADQVVVVLPQQGSPLLTRELVYTAITRARNAVTVVASPQAFIAALANPSGRSSGLQRLLAAMG
jgi:exodeoxyribonuclease V alpha subunit